MSWTLDATAGVYKNHALSSRIREAAIARAVFMRYVRPEQNYGKGRGASITVTRVFPLSNASRVSELDRLPSGRPNIDTVQIATSEWGFKIEMTEFEKNLTHFDLSNQYQRVLRDQMMLTMDAMVSEAMKQTPYKYIPDVSGGQFDTDGTASATADSNLTIADLRRIHDELSGTLKVPPFANGKYVGILTTRAARGIKNDPEYKDWQAPTGSGPLMDGRLRDVEGFQLVETNHYTALDNDVGSGGVLGECLFFGADPAVLATVEEPELRAGATTEDLGRFREVGWVGTLDAGLIWDTASYARVIHVTSA